MKKALTRKEPAPLYYYKNGKRIDGRNPDMTGNCTGLRGDCSNLQGNCSGLRGDLDDCEIIDQDREKGIDIKDLMI